jgi:hypothetical protein
LGCSINALSIQWCGTGAHLGVEKFNLEAGIKVVHAPAKADEAIADVITNSPGLKTDKFAYNRDHPRRAQEA